MADFLIDLDTLNSKKSTLDKMQQNIDTVGKSYDTTSIKKAKSGYNNVATKITNNIERLTKGYTNSCTWLTGYTTDLTSLEQSLTNLNLEDLIEPTEFNGTFEDIFGKVTMPAIKTGGNPNCNSIVKVTKDSDGTIILESLGKQYRITTSEEELYDYYNNVILAQSLYQSASSDYNDQCLGFAFNYVYGLYTNDRSINSSTIRNDTSYGQYFKRFTTNDEREFLDKLYSELDAKKPVVLQVTGSRKRKSRHYVAAFGLDNNVTSAQDLKTTDIVIMDVYDGEIKNTVDRNATSGRCVARGTDINSSRYNYGYEMYYLDI